MILALSLGVIMCSSCADTHVDNSKTSDIPEVSDPEVSSPKVTDTEVTNSEATGFVHASGRLVLDGEGNPLEIRGMAMGNSVWQNPEMPNLNHHTEESFKELSELGFNSMRFYINYGLFESDSNPYEYKESGFEWLDKNIEWAKKYGIGLILNMHYPQGGYQSGGDGLALWQDVENQNRLVALWKEIASRYADEPTIWGYSLLNEPYAPMIDGSVEETAKVYHGIINRIASAIREVSPNQMIVVERLINIVDLETGDSNYWSRIPADVAYPLLEDDNVLYEFHNYNPHAFTHQDSDWAGTLGKTMAYSPEILISGEVESWWVNCIHSKRISTDGEWEFHKTDLGTIGENHNIAFAAVNSPRAGENGVTYFDDITVYEVSPDGEERALHTYDFNDNDHDFSFWSADGSGKKSRNLSEGRDGSPCLEVSGTLADFTSTSSYFAMREGYSYYVTGYIKNEGAGSPVIRLDFGRASKLLYFDIDYLESTLLENIEFSEKNNVPLYLGEFGVISAGFIEGRNGTQWIADMISLCRKYNIGFNYHTYHEGSFGLYQNGDQHLPAMRNDALADLFKEILALY